MNLLPFAFDFGVVDFRLHIINTRKGIESIIYETNIK